MLTIIYIVQLIRGKLDWMMIAKIAVLSGMIFLDILLIGLASLIGFWITILFGI